MSLLRRHPATVIVERSSTPSTFDVLSRAVLPVVLAVLSFRAEGGQFWVYVGLLVVIVFLSFFGSIARWLRRARARWADRRAAREMSSQVRHLVEAFGTLVDPNRNTTLESVLNSHVCRGGVSFDALGLTPTGLFHELWLELRARLEERSSSDPQCVAITLEELTTLVTNYLRHCVDPLFEDPSSERRRMVPEGARPYVEGSRQRLASYVDRLEWCWKDLAGSIRSTSIRQPYLWRPRPL